MRRLLGRKAVTIIAAIVSLTAIPSAGIVASATPALASIHVCLQNTQGCAGAPTVNVGDPVKLTVSGRDINLIHHQFGASTVYQFQIVANPSQCLGISGGFNIDLRNCSGHESNNTDWEKIVGNFTGIAWQSNSLFDWWLDSDGIIGHQLIAGGFRGGNNCAPPCYSV